MVAELGLGVSYQVVKVGTRYIVGRIEADALRPTLNLPLQLLTTMRRPRASNASKLVTRVIL